MGQAREKYEREQHLKRLRQSLPRRTLKAVVNVLSVLPCLLIFAFIRGYQEDHWIWED